MQDERNMRAYKLAAKNYWQQTRKNWTTALPALLFPGLGTILVVYAPPLIIARLLVLFTSHSELSFGILWPYIGLLALVWLAGEALWRIGIQFLSIEEARVSEQLYNQALASLLAKDAAFFNDNFAGSLTKKVTGYARRYQDIMDVFAFSVLPSLIPLVFVVVILWHYSAWLVLILLVMLGLTLATVIPLIRRRQKLVSVRETASNVATGHIADVISNAHTAKAFAREPHEMQIHRQHIHDFMLKTKRSWDYQNLRIDTITAPYYVITNVLGLSAALLLHRHGLAIATVFVTFSYYTSMTRAMWDFNRIYRNIESGLADAAQFTELLLDDPKVNDIRQPIPFKVRLGVINFKNVTFRYKDGADQHLFKDLGLAIEGGEKIALVGRSGGGKSTITRLLLRFMDIDEGQILVDGQDIAQVKQADLRANIAYVPQDPSMFHRSLMDNIRYGRLDATDDEVKKVAKLAHASEFIEKLSSGYETLVGERGIKLSGGQRQRIAIARAMLKNSPILVLDEATSSLDSESELLIQDALWKLMEGRTAIVIAHRLSTIQRVDKIVVLDDGKIAEQGTHKELLEADGIYAKLWAHQSGGFLEE